MGCLKLTYNPEKPTLKVAHSIFNNVKKSSAERYMYGYQGSEKDNEVNSSNGTSYTTEFRQLDTRLGRWFSSDPVFQPWQSSYTSMDNNPVNLTDVEGLSTGEDCAECKNAGSNTTTFKDSKGNIWERTLDRTTGKFGKWQMKTPAKQSLEQKKAEAKDQKQNERKQEQKKQPEQQKKQEEKKQEVQKNVEGERVKQQQNKQTSQNNTTTNVKNTLEKFWDEGKYALPIYGPMLFADDAWKRGDYIDYTSWLAVGTIEMLTLCTSAEIRLALNATNQTLQNTVKTITAAKTSTKLLPQFASSTIDDAVALTMKQKGTHIFANKLHPKPYLNQLSQQMGGQENVIRAALQNANGRFPTSGVINDLPVNVGGMQLYIKGYINNGKPIINSLHNGSLW